MNNKIKNILIRNSDTFKKNKINFIKLLNNYQIGGDKDLTISYNDKKYIFKKSEDIDDHYMLFSKDGDECVYVIISQEDKTAEIHGIGSYSSCLQETNQNVGSTLLKITLKLLKKYQDKFQIKMVILTDNSIKNVIKQI
jgi:NAD-dependent SIR2 family protein deacetylase